MATPTTRPPGSAIVMLVAGRQIANCISVGSVSGGPRNTPDRISDTRDERRLDLRVIALTEFSTYGRMPGHRRTFRPGDKFDRTGEAPPGRFTRSSGARNSSSKWRSNTSDIRENFPASEIVNCVVWLYQVRAALQSPRGPTLERHRAPPPNRCQYDKAAGGW